MKHLKWAALILMMLALPGSEAMEAEAQDIPVQERQAVVHHSPKAYSSRQQLKNKRGNNVSKRSFKRYSGRTAALEKNTSEKNPDLEIGLISGSAEVSVTGLNPYNAYVRSTKWKSFKPGESVTITRSGKDIYLNGRSAGPELILAGMNNEDPNFSVKGKKYRGRMKIIPSAWNNGVTVVNVLPMEDYLKGVVPCEVPSSWPSEALKAQAVAARTYALYHRTSSQYKRAGFELTDDTRSQMYEGASAEAAATNKAVDDTRGEILTYGGHTIDAVFSADAGGYTESALNMWGTDIPYLQAVPEENEQPPEVKKMPLNMFIKRFKDAGLPVYGFRGVKLTRLQRGSKHSGDRYESGRVKYVTIFGKFGSRQVKGTTVRDLFNLKTTMFDFAIKNKMVTITCYGYGHGVGLSQWGAETMAKKHGNKEGYYKTILTHYYTGAQLKKLY